MFQNFVDTVNYENLRRLSEFIQPNVAVLSVQKWTEEKFNVLSMSTKLAIWAPIVAASYSSSIVLVCFMGATRDLLMTYFTITFPSLVVDLI